MIDWTPSEIPVRLRPGEIRIFRGSLETDQEQFSSLLSILSAEERDRADRFVFPQDRERFVNGRGTLRIILGSVTGLPPAAISLRKGKYGKLHLDVPDGGHRLHFNLSHSEGQILYAFSETDEIGIDLEKVRIGDALVEGVSEFFTPAERATVEQSLKHGELEPFYRCWVMKEAYTKARGEGLQIPLNSFELPGDWVGAELERPVEVEGWAIHPFRPATGYVAALARPKATAPSITFWEWPTVADRV